MVAEPVTPDRSLARRGNASCDAPRRDFKSGRRASRAAFPRRAWERSSYGFSQTRIIRDEKCTSKKRV
ncbi:DUF1534 domain-containing protein [Pseudomonas sp. CCM 7891]|uniref:DUF1534 domain-containing protein n=1 Tax=Pseudomonas karstica TaxID=1055468 RepID=A0A7X2RUC5_9PSED|nr:DUF1534 domain-containing protein [Pseudomonas karstica]